MQEVKKLDPERLKQKLQLLVVKAEKVSVVLTSGLNLIMDSTRDTSTQQLGVGACAHQYRFLSPRKWHRLNIPPKEFELMLERW